MKKLTLTDTLRSRLDRLSTGVDDLYYIGLNPNNITSKPCVAVVGTRKITPHGKAVTEAIVADLVREGVVIISGLAFGADITAHKTVLKEGGMTIAVVASDLGHIYPTSHRPIAQQIAQPGVSPEPSLSVSGVAGVTTPSMPESDNDGSGGSSGTIISEYKDNPRPRANQFLERNRIIAALSDAVFIPEAASRSGSLNTAMHAASMDIPVFAAPGRSSDLMSAGTNDLIKTGKATLTTDAADILSVLDIQPATKKKAPKGTNTHETAVLMAIQSGIHDTTLLQKELAMDTARLQTTLTMLEINGQVVQDELGRWQTVG